MVWFPGAGVCRVVLTGTTGDAALCGIVAAAGAADVAST